MTTTIILTAYVAVAVVAYVVGFLVATSDVEGQCAVAAELARQGERARLNAKWRQIIRDSYVSVHKDAEL